jgi:hypothetical protein
MRSIIIALALALLGSSAIASASETYGVNTLPSCDSPAKVVIFHGESFEGTVYLHDADVKLSQSAVYAVRQIAEIGQIPVVCQDAGTVVVTVQHSNNDISVD